jgi:hypothetical protein
MTPQEHPEALILTCDLARCLLHLLRCGDTHRLVMLNARLEVFQEILPTSP